MVAAFQEKISVAAECLEDRVKDKVCQEVMHHSNYCKKKAKTFMVSIFGKSDRQSPPQSPFLCFSLFPSPSPSSLLPLLAPPSLPPPPSNWFH